MFSPRGGKAGDKSGGDELQDLKRALQDQRRRATLLSADIQRQIEAREAVEVQLMEVQDELTASQNRRKEMARVITNREAKIAQLNEQLQARYEELAALQRHMMRLNPLAAAKGLFRRLGKMTKKRFRAG